MEKQHQITHLRLTLQSTYEAFTKNIEHVLNRLEPGWSKKVATNPTFVKKLLNGVAGETGLMIFGDQQHGQLLMLEGISQKAVQYTIGNPLTALEMTRHDIRAALYAPVRMIVYEDKDRQVYAEYDLPSSQFGQFGSEVLSIARGLDKKLEEAILKADLQPAG